jgi:OFA family oxalate/formate antiporter-like MFS transporter
MVARSASSSDHVTVEANGGPVEQSTGPDLSARRYYHGWNIVGMCVAVQVAALGLTLNCFSLFLKDWTAEFGMPVSSFALGVAIFSIGCALLAPFSGQLADRAPAKWLFSALLVALALIHLAISLVGNGWQIVWIYAAALPVAVTLSSGIPSQTVVSRWFVRRVGLAMGFTAFGLALSGVLLPTGIVKLLPLIGWRAIWQIFAGLIVLVILPLVVIAMRDRPGAEEGAHYVGDQPKATHHVAHLSAWQVFARPNFWVIVAAFLPVQCVSISMTVNLTPIVTSYGYSRGVAGAMIGVLSLSALIAKLVAGLAADRFGNRVPMVATGLLCASGVALLLSHANLVVLGLAFMLIGLSAGSWTLLASATAAEFGKQGFGRAFGLVCVFPPFAAIAPPVVARLREVSGTYSTGLAGLAVLAVLGAGAALLLRERGHRA